jgi:hypothetical protein
VTTAAAAVVVVTWLATAHFTDFKMRCSTDGAGVERLQAELTSFLEKQATPLLQAPGSLEITVVDVDMAGEFEPWRGPQFCDTRMMREHYPARIRLRFRLMDGAGHVVKSGERELADALYLMKSRTVAQSDPLRYEKQLLRDWIRMELAPRPR